MALTASLQLRQNQSLVMTPQLMQSIRLLQLTHLELSRFVDEEVARNPLIEHQAAADAGDEGGSEIPPMRAAEERTREKDWFDQSATRAGESLADRLDTSYENVFPDDGVAAPPDAPELASRWKSMPGAAGLAAGENFDPDDFTAPTETLRDHVDRQIALLGLTADKRLIAAELADQLDEAGYVTDDIGEIAERLNARRSEVEAILRQLQELEPAGIFARSLAECLEIQLRQRDRCDPAMLKLISHLELLARRDFQSLRRICGVDEEDLLDMLAEIRALDPKPGTRFQFGVMEAIVADVFVTPSSEGGWHVELNGDTLPKVLVNQAYYARASRQALRSGEDREFLDTCLQNANWLTRSLDQRARTILKVAREIVRQQDQFLLRGVGSLRPLNLKTVADAIGMHESTVSRVTSNKYMLTPRGVFELKYFFSVSIASAEGGDAHSAEAVRHRIRAMIAAETPDGVLSDDAIVSRLKSDGIDIARRTIAKYREAMNIPSSVQRRREKKALARSGTP